MKYLYWAATAVMCLIFAFSAQMYLRNTEMIQAYFENNMGYPSYLVLPLAALKIMGIIAVVSRKSKMLTEWAYAGFFLDAVLAFAAHWVAKDGGHMMAGIAIVATVLSRFAYGQLYNKALT